MKKTMNPETSLTKKLKTTEKTMNPETSPTKKLKTMEKKLDRKKRKKELETLFPMSFGLVKPTPIGIKKEWETDSKNRPLYHAKNPEDLESYKTINHEIDYDFQYMASLEKYKNNTKNKELSVENRSNMIQKFSGHHVETEEILDIMLQNMQTSFYAIEKSLLESNIRLFYVFLLFSSFSFFILFHFPLSYLPSVPVGKERHEA